MPGLLAPGWLKQANRVRAPVYSASPYLRGRGILAGTDPNGLTTVTGAPDTADVIVQVRAPGHPLDGSTVVRTTSNVGGEWLIGELDHTRMYTVLAQKAGECDVAKSEVYPLVPLEFPAPAFFVVRMTESRSLQFAAAGGEGPYTYAITAGSLPTGFSLVADEIVATTPLDTAGDYPITVEVTDARSDTATADIVVRLVYVPLQASSTMGRYLTIPNATAFSEAVTGSFGTAPYTYAVSSRALPAGVSLNTSTGALTGTTTTEDDYTFTITVTDAVAATMSFTTTVLVTSVVAHRYWRINISAGNGNVDTSLNTLEFRIKHLGTDVPALSGMFANTEYSSSFLIAYAFDATSNRWAAAGSVSPFTPYPHAIGRVMTDPVPIYQVSLTGGPTAAQCPNAFDVESSDDGETWTVEWSVTGQTAWGANATRVFTRP